MPRLPDAAADRAGGRDMPREKFTEGSPLRRAGAALGSSDEDAAIGRVYQRAGPADHHERLP